MKLTQIDQTESIGEVFNPGKREIKLHIRN